MAENLNALATDFAKRKADEHFGSFPEAQEAAERVKADCFEIDVPAKDMRFEGDPSGTFRLRLGDHLLSPTPYVAEKVCQIVGADPSFFRRLTVGTMSTAINEAWCRVWTENKPMRVLARRVDGEAKVCRSITTGMYARVWDAELLDQVDRWLLPTGFAPAVPTINQTYAKKNPDGTLKPALFMGDRSSHFFFYRDAKPGDDGLGGLRRGFLISNSEVGARALRWTTCYFRDLCANFIIWNATKVKERRVRHMQKAVAVGVPDLIREMQSVSGEVSALLYDAMSRAQHAEFVTEKSDIGRRTEAIKRLRNGFGLTKERAERAVTAAAMPENLSKNGNVWSVFSIVQGVSFIAKREETADEMVALGETAGRILAEAAASV